MPTLELTDAEAAIIQLLRDKEKRKEARAIKAKANKEARKAAAVASPTQKEFAERNGYIFAIDARNLYWAVDISISCFELGQLARLGAIPAVRYKNRWFFKPEDIQADIMELKAAGRHDRFTEIRKGQRVAASEDVYYA